MNLMVGQMTISSIERLVHVLSLFGKDVVRDGCSFLLTRIPISLETMSPGNRLTWAMRR